MTSVLMSTETTELPFGCVSEASSSVDDDEFMPAPSSWYHQHEATKTEAQEHAHVLSSNQQQLRHQRDAMVGGEPNRSSNATNNIRHYSNHGEVFRAPSLPPPAHAHLAAPIAVTNHEHHASAAATAAAVRTVGSPHPAPSWTEIRSQILPAAARELLSSSMQKICHTARFTYAQGRSHRRHSDMFSNNAGYFKSTQGEEATARHMLYPDRVNAVQMPELPPFSSLPWVDRQMVKEWRTINVDGNDAQQQNQNLDTNNKSNNPSHVDNEEEQEEEDFARARTLIPTPAQRPVWQKAETCFSCRKTFGPTRLRHHCRLCGYSFCQLHSAGTQKLPHLGYHPDVPERVCNTCFEGLAEQRLAERVAWRLARCRDYQEGSQLTPYFETGVDTLEDAALRLTNAALSMAKSIPLGAQATVAVETVNVLRQHGLNGIYTILLRQEFLAAADLLRRTLGINRTAWPLSVHELSAAIFYALAQQRAMRGMHPEREDVIHSFRQQQAENGGRINAKAQQNLTLSTALEERGVDESELYRQDEPEARPSDLTAFQQALSRGNSFTAVCDPLPDEDLASLIVYAPLALTFIYAEREVDIQLLAAQQGWRLLYAYMETQSEDHFTDRPASAVFVHEEQKVVCMAIRGTSTIHDVVTDIRQEPVPFPEASEFASSSSSSGTKKSATADGDWTTVSRGQGLAVSGMACAAVNLFREHVDSILHFAQKGYKIRLTGHSLGGGVASMLGVLFTRGLKEIGCETCMRVIAYGTPSCVDARLSEFMQSFVTTVVLHDDVVPRLTPSSCRGLLKHLLHIRDTWVKQHMHDDIMAITDRAKLAWAPRWREGFTLSTSTHSLKKYCRKQLQSSKRKLLSVTEKLVGDSSSSTTSDKKSCHSAEDAAMESTTSIGNGDNLCVDESLPDPPEIASEPRPIVDYIGAMDSRKKGIAIDGDEFFDADENLVVDESEEEEIEDSINAILRESAAVEKSAAGDSNNKSGEVAVEEEDGPGVVLLAETPLPRLFIPGKIVHIYSHHGVYKAAYVPRAFRELRRISLAGNMLADHKCKSYYEALLEVRTVRKAPENPPRWTPFDEDDTCSCCASRFTWASTCDSIAQEARDKHNCRSCGTLVCQPCSANRIPIPSIGLSAPSRVCDRCYNDMEGVLTSPLGDQPKESTKQQDKPVRLRERRSSVVDELASQIKRSTWA